MTRSGDPNLNFMVEERDDAGDAVLADYDEKRSKQKNPPKGASRFLVPVMLDGSPVPEGGLAREQFYAQMEKSQGDRQSDLTQELLEEGLIEKRPAGGYDPSEYGDGA